MIPGGQLSSEAITARIIGGRGKDISGTRDFEHGGIALNDPSEGKMFQIWSGKLEGNNIILESPSTDPEVIYNASGITEFSFTFDQNMRPTISFIQDTIAKYRWYDSTIPDYRVSIIPGDIRTPKVFLDDKRVSQDLKSDILLAYIKVRRNIKDLYYRLQRDRYATEYLLKKNCGGLLHTFGMNKKLRLQFEINLDG